MTEPTREPRPTDVFQQHDFDLGLPDESQLAEEMPADYVREPLFSRRVMIAWATGAFVLWFGVTFIVPEIVSSIKAEIRESVREPGTNTRVRVRDRTVIIETPGGPSVAEPEPAPPAPEPLPPSAKSIPKGEKK